MYFCNVRELGGVVSRARRPRVRRVTRYPGLIAGRMSVATSTIDVMVDQTLLTQAKQLTPADRLELIGELWQTLDHEALPVTDAERTMLDERLADLSADPESGRSWEEAEAELRRRLP